MNKNIKKYLWIIVVGAVLIVAGIIITVLVLRANSRTEKVVFNSEAEYLEQLAKEIYRYNLNETTDTDKDGITDMEEVEKYSSSPFTNDSDGDGLGDYAEIFTYVTDPNREDTDGDKVSDGDEVLAGLNPLEKKTDGKKTDNEVTFERNYTMSGLALDIVGGASVCNVYLDEFSLGGENTNGLISPIYELYTSGKFDEATITIEFDPNKISSESSVDNLSIYQYVDSGDWVKVKSKIDEGNSTISANLEHFSKYTVLDSTLIGEEKEINVMFLIDDSGSMYPEDMCEGSTESDLEFKRLDLVNDLAKKFDDDINLGMASFTADYMEQCEMGATDEEIYTATENIRNQSEHNFNGTYILNALDSALKTPEFESNDANYIVLLTDGASTESYFDLVFASYSRDTIIEEANDKNVKIISIGLGTYIEVDFLTDFTQNTRGLYSYANNADALDNVYNKIMNLINESYIDNDEDGKSDEVLIADSGFDVMTEGLSFSNPVIHLNGETGSGVCAGIAIFEQLNHLGIVPCSMSAFDYTDYELWGVRWMSKTFKLGDYENVAYEECPGYEVTLLEDLGFTIKGDTAVMNNVHDNLCTKTTKQLMSVSSMEAEERFEADGDELTYADELMDTIADNEMIEAYSFEGSWELWGSDYEKCEYLGYNLDEDFSDDNKEYEKTIKIFQLFTRLFYEQFNTDSYVAYTFDSNFDEITNQLMSGNALYMDISGNHAINAVSLTRDFELAYIYYLYAYDNNHPEELQKYTVEITGDGTVQVTNPSGDIVSVELRDYRFISQ